MRRMLSALVTMALVAALSPADEPEVKAKPDYTEFAKLIHRLVASQATKQFEHRDGWGGTIPLPDKRLPLPNLRTYLKDGDKVVLPHGAWKKIKMKLEDPARDLKIQVKDFKPIDGKSYRLVLDADLVLYVDGEWQQWQKGLMLIGAGGNADVYMKIGVGCDIGTAFALTKDGPQIKLSPKITELTLDMKDIRPRGGPILTGERGEKLAAEIKGLIRGAVKSSEPQVREMVNQAIAQALQDGKNGLPAGDLIKALPK